METQPDQIQTTDNRWQSAGISLPQFMVMVCGLILTAVVLLLTAAPWVVLLFGATATVAGILVVHHSQRKIQQIQALNSLLAQTRFDLNHEMSERERLSGLMRRAEREYRAVIDSVSDIVFELSDDGSILFLSQAWEKCTGVKISAAIGRSLFDFLPAAEREEQSRNFAQLTRRERAAYKVSTRLQTAEGRFRAVEMNMAVIRQDENRAVRVAGVFVDMEDRLRAEKTLSEAEKKYRTIIENAAGGIYQVTPEGKFLSANLAMARILGYDSPEQVVEGVANAHRDLYIDPRDRQRFIRDLEQFGVAKNFEARVLRRDGEKIWINENARVVRDDEGGILYFEGSLEDITKRKETEIKLREAKIHSDLASRAKSEFLTNMSHELRTPLNSIIGFSEILKNEVLGPIENRQYWEYACDIHEGGRNLLGIINEILDASRIETGDRELNESIVDIAAVARKCSSFIMSKATMNGLTLENNVTGAVPGIIGEELAIKQIILNLLSNAIKFTPAGGRITLSYEIDDDGQMRLSVTDTGVGLNESEIAKALSPFGQVQTSFNRSSSGIGLGLTLVDSLIKMHGGRLELFSQKGLGTTATIVFPAERVSDFTAAAGGR